MIIKQRIDNKTLTELARELVKQTEYLNIYEKLKIFRAIYFSICRVIEDNDGVILTVLE